MTDFPAGKPLPVWEQTRVDVDFGLMSEDLKSFAAACTGRADVIGLLADFQGFIVHLSDGSERRFVVTPA